MIDDNEEPNSIALVMPDDLGAGPRTLVKVRFNKEAEVVMPVSVSTAADLVAEWEGLVKDKADPRHTTRYSIVELFKRERHFTDTGVPSITAAVLYLALNSSNPSALETVLERGGCTIIANISEEGPKNYRFRVEVEG